MKILKVIHGYPMRYNAGSEIYSQTLCRALADAGHEVQVFTREEDPFKCDFILHQELDPGDCRILLNIVNIPRERYRYKFCVEEIDQQFSIVLDQFCPDVIHIGHLNHLSLSIVYAAEKRKIPLIYTLHDYWLMCPRGQFIQRNSKEEIWSLCQAQENEKCARQCYAGYFSGVEGNYESEFQYWTSWINHRMQVAREVSNKIDLFIAPAQFLRNKFINEFGLPESKIMYQDYGFDLTQLNNRHRHEGQPFTFGYIGTHTPAKGIQHLMTAFDKLTGEYRLKIWGHYRSDYTNPLKEYMLTLSDRAKKSIEWSGEYKNENVVRDVFNHIDAIVVPSIWYENSPLVIHEAQQVGVPVITAAMGGMAEYVQHEINGLLFKPRDPESLGDQMQRFVDNPIWAQELGSQRYLYSDTGDVPSIQTQAQDFVERYNDLIIKKTGKKLPKKPGPWRITFDTNPDDCNLRCIMCEGFSPYSTVQKDRIHQRKRKRRMDIALMRKILEEARGTPLKEIIPSTMGEPLVYKHFDEIIQMCHEFGVKLNLTTNGTFPIKGAKEWAKLIVPVTSDVKVSWNGATKETQEVIMKGHKWDKILDNLKTFLVVRDQHAEQGGNRCQVTLQLTFLQTNVSELADIVKLGIDLGVDRIKGHHLWAHFKEIKDLSMRRNDDSIQEWNKAVNKARSVRDKFLFPNGKRILLENIEFLSEGAHKDLTPGGLCPFLGKEAWVSAEGRFSPCCAPDEQRKQLGDFGDIINQSIENVLAKSKISRFKEKLSKASIVYQL